MKTYLPKAIACAAVLGLFVSPSAFAKKKPLNLTAFAGKYTGNVTFTPPSGDTSSGTAVVIITVPKNGKSATVSYTATVTSGSGDTSVLPTAITLAANKTLSITDLGVGIAGTNNAHRGTGNWIQQKRSLTLFATNGDINFRGNAAVKDTRKKRNLTLILVSSDADGSNPYTFTTTLTAKLPKPKK
jgi:hypothetical protein